jgi:predicted amidophosphoribosyltransferase
MSIIRTCVDCAATSDGRYAAPYCCGSQRMLMSYACDACGAVTERSLHTCGGCRGAVTSNPVRRARRARRAVVKAPVDDSGQGEMW